MAFCSDPAEKLVTDVLEETKIGNKFQGIKDFKADISIKIFKDGKTVWTDNVEVTNGVMYVRNRDTDIYRIHLDKQIVNEEIDKGIYDILTFEVNP